MIRREFVRNSVFAMAGATMLPAMTPFAQIAGERPAQAEGIRVLNPCNRVPVSLIIDDSTSLVNMAHFGIPQFAQTFPEQYKQNWRRLPREIPDSFVRQFAEWSLAEGVKGKYSMVPYPACVGWLDRTLPGWSHQELQDSLKLVHEMITPHWDIHPEMVSHTRVIDLKTGRPYPDPSPQYMENWEWTRGKSADEIGAYIAYGLQILKNVGFTCEGVTTPGGFGSNALPELAQGTMQACKAVYQTEIPHYFRHLFTGDESVAPRVEYVSGLDTDHPDCVVSIIGCTGDWFGGWDGLEAGSVDQLITVDGQGGRMPEVIRRGEPAIMVCHWPGIYFNGEEIGFSILIEAVKRLKSHYNNLIWMKLSEISRYWAAKELTTIQQEGERIVLSAPFATPQFTLVIPEKCSEIRIVHEGQPVPLQRITASQPLSQGTWVGDETHTTLCFALGKGQTEILRTV
jgi:hypothetical protein